MKTHTCKDSRAWILLSALLMVISFPPWDLIHPIWICLVPWLYSLSSRTSWKSALWDGALMSFFVTCGGFFWIANVLHEFGGLPWPIAIAMFLAFAFVAQTQFLILSLIFWWSWRKQEQSLAKFATLKEGRHHLIWALYLALAYTGIDWCIPKLFTDTLGHCFYLSPWLRQVADLTGVFGLTFAVMLTNLLLFSILKQFIAKTEPSFHPLLTRHRPLLVCTFTVIVGFITYGGLRLEQVRQWMTTPKDSIQIATIQANIGDFDKVAAETGVRGAAEKVLNTYYRLSIKALESAPTPDALVWPETAYPSLFRTPTSSTELARDQALEHFVLSHQIPLLFGGYDHENKKDFNALFYLSPEFGSAPKVDLHEQQKALSTSKDSLTLASYRKNILLLFGEYIPGAETFDWIKKAFPQVGNFGRGVGPQSLPIFRRGKKAVFTAPLICYEILFPQFVLEAVRQGAELLMNVTNDSWFGIYAEPELHLALSTFRSIETRVPTLRATNTGISALILPDGEIKFASKINTESILNWNIPIYGKLGTPLLTLGHWFGLFSLLMALLFFWKWKSLIS